jgi:hypothetical protein
LSAAPVTLKIELKDEADFDAFARRQLTPGAGGWVTLSLPLGPGGAFTDSVKGGGNPAAFDWTRVSALTLVIERQNLAAGVQNPDTGRLLIDNLVLADTDGASPDLAAIEDQPTHGVMSQFEDAFLDLVRPTSTLYRTSRATTIADASSASRSTMPTTWDSTPASRSTAARSRRPSITIPTRGC